MAEESEPPFGDMLQQEQRDEYAHQPFDHVK
jgi:hypothetical protein